MKTAVDSNILIDMLADDPSAAEAARQALSAASEAGALVLCPVVYAEVYAGIRDSETLAAFLADADLALEHFSEEALRAVGEAWNVYLRRRNQQLVCARCGEQFGVSCPSCKGAITRRQHLITDFLIGGHAATQSDALITRDRGYYRTYFPQLRIIAPDVR